MDTSQHAVRTGLWDAVKAMSEATEHWLLLGRDLRWVQAAAWRCSPCCMTLSSCTASTG